MISQFYVLFGLECGDYFERWIGGMWKEEFITLARTFSCSCLIDKRKPQRTSLRISEFRPKNQTLTILVVNQKCLPLNYNIIDAKHL